MSDKTTVQRVVRIFGYRALATTKLDSADGESQAIRKMRKGPLTIAAAGLAIPQAKENSEGRFVVVGSSSWAANSFLAFNGNSDGPRVERR